MIERIAQEVHVAALPGGLGEHLAQGLLDAGMVVGDDEIYAAQAALAQADEEVLPARAGLAVGQDRIASVSFRPFA